MNLRIKNSYLKSLKNSFGVHPVLPRLSVGHSEPGILKLLQARLLAPQVLQQGGLARAGGGAGGALQRIRKEEKGGNVNESKKES